MAIQFSGSDPRDYTFVSAGTRDDLATQFRTQAIAVGWTSITSSILETATTPQGLKIRVDVIDPGSGNCIQFKIRNNASLVGPWTIFLLPVGGETFRLWINKYQFFYFLSGSDMSRQRSFVCGGVPWVPDFIRDSMSNSYAGWLHGNGSTDTDTRNLGGTFRKLFVASSVLNYSALWNGTAFGSINTLGNFGLCAQTAGTAIDDMWDDGTFSLFEPILVFQSSNFTTAVRHGLLWDAALGSKPLDSELRRTFGDVTWRNITHQSTSFPGRGSLFLKVVV